MKYDASNGAQLAIQKSTDAPTIVMSKYIMFGHVDLVAKSSPGTGIVSSFVLLSQDLDEIDWEWLGGDNYNVQTNFFGKGDTSSYDRAASINVQTPIDMYHKYSIDWTAERMVWLIDDAPVRTVSYNDALARGGKMYPQTPMVVKFGNWIGCLDSSNPQTTGTCQWAGGQADLSKGPFIMSIKSINVTDYGCGGEYTYSDKSGNWQSIKSNGKCDGKGTGPTTPPPAAAAVGAAGAAGVASGAKLPDTQGSGSSSDPAPSGAAVPLSFAAPHSNSTKSTGQSTSSALDSSQSTHPGTGTEIAKGVNDNSPLTTSEASGKSKQKFGKIDLFVIIFGLCLGYLVM